MKDQIMLARALALMCTAFEFRTDKGGYPYSLHCIRVWNRVKHLSIEAQCAAILHDVVEDTHWTIEKLALAGFSKRVCWLVDLLTHDRDKHSYEEYITTRIAIDIELIDIKMADLEDNSDITRLKGVEPKDVKRITKYHLWYTYLKQQRT